MGKNDQVIKTEENVEVDMFHLGNYRTLIGYRSSIIELSNNGIDAAVKAKKPRVHVEIIHGDKYPDILQSDCEYLAVLNNGTPIMDFKTFLDNGYKTDAEKYNKLMTQKRRLSMHGMGAKLCFGKFSPENEDFCVVTRHKSKRMVKMVSGPYTSKMTVKTYLTENMFGLPEWITTAVFVRIENEKLEFDDLYDYLCEKYSELLLRRKNLEITYGKDEKILVPKELPHENGKKQIIIRDDKKIPGVWMDVEVNDGNGGAGTYGIYIRYQGVLVKRYLPGEIIAKTQYVGHIQSIQKNQYITNHPTLYPFSVSVNIGYEDGYDADKLFKLPLSTDKTSFDEDTSEWKVLRKIIDDACGDNFRKINDARLESEGKKKTIAYLKKEFKVKRNFAVIPEVQIGKGQHKDSESLRVDAMIIKLHKGNRKKYEQYLKDCAESNGKKVYYTFDFDDMSGDGKHLDKSLFDDLRVIEFKAPEKKQKVNSLTQTISYGNEIALLLGCDISDIQLYLYAQAINDMVKKHINLYTRLGYDIEFQPLIGY